MSTRSSNFSYIIFTIFLTNTNTKFDFYRFISLSGYCSIFADPVHNVFP